MASSRRIDVNADLHMTLGLAIRFWLFKEHKIGNPQVLLKELKDEQEANRDTCTRTEAFEKWLIEYGIPIPATLTRWCGTNVQRIDSVAKERKQPKVMGHRGDGTTKVFYGLSVASLWPLCGMAHYMVWLTIRHGSFCGMAGKGRNECGGRTCCEGG